MRKTEKEISEIKKQNVFLFEKQLLEKRLPIDEVGEQFSGIPHLNNLQTFAWDWLPKSIANKYEVDIEGAKKLSLEGFAQKYIHPITVKHIAPKYIHVLQSGNSNVIHTFNYIRLNEKTEYGWTHTTWLFSHELGNVIGIAHYLKDIETEIDKEKKLLGEYEFIRKNFSAYMQLTSRQKQVLKLLALGYSNQVIASELNVSPNTVRSHRNHIHNKLDLRWKNINHAQKYLQYALHFGLIE